MRIKLLLVEDDDTDSQGFLQSVERFNHENKTSFEVVVCSTLEGALATIDGSFDGAVVDMRLGDAGGEGNELLRVLEEKNFRIPVVVFTGTPDAADHQFVHIDVKTKDTSHNEILEDFRLVHASGLTKVMGGRGLIEELLSKVYKNNLLNQKEAWKRYGRENAERSEKALMRHVLNHLMQLVDLDEESCVPEEFYVYPPMNKHPRTGGVVRAKDSRDFFAIMNPLCDLTVRDNGLYNARKILVCRIVCFDECAEHLSEKKQNARGYKELRKNLDGNKKSSYHALPRTEFFDGGYLDFESLSSFSKTRFNADFEDPHLQISPAFTKDIVSRFSAYYGRQGQPTLSQLEE